MFLWRFDISFSCLQVDMATCIIVDRYVQQKENTKTWVVSRGVNYAVAVLTCRCSGQQGKRRTLTSSIVNWRWSCWFTPKRGILFGMQRAVCTRDSGAIRASLGRGAGSWTWPSGMPQMVLSCFWPLYGSNLLKLTMSGFVGLPWVCRLRQ